MKQQFLLFVLVYGDTDGAIYWSVKCRALRCEDGLPVAK